ncbi:MAG TPA: two-component regulator propeller domain-containing protein, partial [Myxococcota bacterium]|nr:two-component regulator propeller domain-containing protein [Myxococcota bacterium]
MSDVMMHDRALSPDEIKVLASNRVERPLRPTRCRDRAAGIALPRHTGIMPDVWVEDHFLHRRYTSDDGLPGNEVRCVLQANDGHVWVGTKEGFARFDGSRFLVFTPENTPGLRRTSADVRSICEGQDGTVWIGTFGGLLRVDGSGVNVVTNGLPELFILRLEPGPDGTLWVACLHNGDRSRGPCWVVRYDPKSQRVLSRTRASNQVYELRSTEGGLWMVTESEVLLWDGQADLPEQWLRPGDFTRAVHLGSSRVAAGTREWVASLAAPRIGPFLEITGSGFPGSLSWSVDRTRLPRTGRRFGPPTGEWQGTRDGLFQKTSSGWRRVVMGAERMPQEIYCLTANREGGVWYGTGNEDGLHLLIPREARPYSLAQGMPDAEVNS